MTDFDNINRPAHYAKGRRFEVIEVLEDWAQFAPNIKQGIALAQALKYLGRLWTKNDGITATPESNLRKAQWYLDRLNQHMIDDDPDSGLDLDPFDHPDVMGPQFEHTFRRNIGLEGGISDEDDAGPRDVYPGSVYDDVLEFRDVDLSVDVGRRGGEVEEFRGSGKGGGTGRYLAEKDTWTA